MRCCHRDVIRPCRWSILLRIGMTAQAAASQNNGTRTNLDTRAIHVSRDNACDSGVCIGQEGRRLDSEPELYTAVDGGLEQCCNHRVADDESRPTRIPEPIDCEPRR